MVRILSMTFFKTPCLKSKEVYIACEPTLKKCWNVFKALIGTISWNIWYCHAFCQKKKLKILYIIRTSWRHFTPYALVFQIFFIYLFFLKKWKLTNIENKTLINIRQHRQKAFATLSRSWLVRGWGRGGWVNPLKKKICGENLFYR